MKEKVFFIPVKDNESDSAVAQRVRNCLSEKMLLDHVKDRDMVAIKTHFGETAKSGYARPELIKTLGGIVTEKKGLPFLTETSTLYKGNRNNAVEHIMLAHRHGFGYENTGLPIIMADGLLGDQETEVSVGGRLHESVHVAALVSRVQSMIVVSHFTGHLAAGFGAALKNIGMGLASRKGKLNQHSTAKPSIKSKKCTQCGVCITWCPESAITMGDDSAVIDKVKCIGCGECLAVCRFDAVGYNWAVTYEDLQKKVVEHALGVVRACPGKILFVNVLTRMSKDCDCMDSFEKMLPDIGILISFDPVAVDAASLDLVEDRGGRSLSDMAYNIPYRCQIDHARDISFGNPDYELVRY